MCLLLKPLLTFKHVEPNFLFNAKKSSANLANRLPPSLKKARIVGALTEFLRFSVRQFAFLLPYKGVFFHGLEILVVIRVFCVHFVPTFLLDYEVLPCAPL